MAFDLQAHRGGTALTVENTLPAFARALEVGVSTLEFDVQLTRDGQVVVAHDRDPRPELCLDTEPAFPGDPQFPYVRDETYLVELTLAQVRTIDAGSLRHPDYPQQRLAPGARIPLLSEVFDLVRRYDADVGMNIELKIELVEGRTATREEFVAAVVPLVAASGLLDRVSIESFDWGALRRVRAAEPRLELVALADRRHLGRSETATYWTGGVGLADPAECVGAVAELGATTFSPEHRTVTPALVAQAAEVGLGVLPWTVDEAEQMRRLIDGGVAGLITDRPDLAREVMAERGLELPARYRSAEPLSPRAGR